jgi:hypothetical protein
VHAATPACRDTAGMAEREPPHATLFEMLMYERRRHPDVQQCCITLAGRRTIAPRERWTVAGPKASACW